MDGTSQSSKKHPSNMRIFKKPTVQLFGDSAQTIRAAFEKAQYSTVAGNQPDVKGNRIEHPFDYVAVGQFKNSNPYHSTCLETKVAATTGINFYDYKEKALVNESLPELGYRTVKKETAVAKATRGMSNGPFISELNATCQDYWSVGIGYLEVVRQGPGGEIVGLHHLPARRVWKFIEEDGTNYHYEIDAEGHGSNQRFAVFGDSVDFYSRYEQVDNPEDGQTISEVICFRQPSSGSRHYSIPDWISAVQPIELVQCILQHKFDFFQNRGVPEFMLFILGQQVDEDTWNNIEDAVQANMGLGNSHKSIAINLSNPDVKVQVEKLAMENKLEDEINASSDPLALMVVSAHRVPPLLAGIQVPGKLGATNELPNALMAFQKLVVDEAQAIFHETLGLTLGDDEDGIPGLSMEDFAFSSILDEFDLDKMDTMARMREPVTSTDRNLEDGLED